MAQLNLQDAFLLALKHHQARQLQEAEQLYRQVLIQQPDHAGALHYLGVIAHQVGRDDLAVDLITRSIAIAPGHPEAHYNLGIAAGQTGQLDQAIAAYRQAIALNPDYAEAYYNLGILLKARGQADEAIAAYRQAITLKPGHAQACNNLGIALKEQGQLDEAITAFGQAIVASPNYAEATHNLGAALAEKGRIADAIAAYRQAIALRPDYAEAHCNLGYLYKEQGRDELAGEHYRLAIQSNPRLSVAYMNLGVLREQAGDLEEAEHYYRQAIGLAKNDALCHAKLASLLGRDLPEADLKAMEGLLADPSVDAAGRSALHFAAAQVLDARDGYAQASEHIVAANALAKSEAERKGAGYDPAAHAGFMGRMIEVCSADFFRRAQDLGLPAQRPVFVFGLPRSGTTLTEQILAGHTQVFGAGELVFARIDFLSLAGESTAALEVREEMAFQKLDRIDRETLQYIAGRHLLQLDQLNSSAPRIVDKMPENYLYLGLLAAMFPEARFIHCRREARDVAISCFMTRFESLPWANDLEQITSRIEQYRRLMRHWRTLLEGRWLDCDYEQTVADLPGTARRLIDWCGLDWQPACVDFHTVRRPVRTSSSAQVRRRLFNRSVGRWKHYQELLAPVLDRLCS